MIRRSVREWGRIAYGDGEDRIPLWAADRLGAVARAALIGGADGGDILTLGRHHLSVGQIVGVLAAEGCALEILPKIGALDAGGVRRQLVHMLAVALDLDIADGAAVDLDWQDETLLDILIRLFARRLGEAVRRGMPRRYVAQADDLPALRGRLDAQRQFTTLAAAPHRLACRFDDLSPDIALNHIMKATVLRLSRLAHGIETQRLLRELTFTYADIAEVPVRALRWDAVVLDRTNARWRELLALARLLLGDRFQGTSDGAQAGTALLFPMNFLFEEYVTRTLRRALRTDGLEVAAQGGGLYCLRDLGTGAGYFRTRPDILVRRDGAVVLIIDTKWKRLKPRSKDAKRGITHADVYQMMAYGRLYDCPRLMLLYPHAADLDHPEGLCERHAVANCADALLTATVDFSGLEDMAGRLRAMVLEGVG